MNGFANNEFIDFSSSQLKNKHNSGLCNLPNHIIFPFHIIQKGGLKYFITPICFSGPLKFSSKKDLEQIKNQYTDINGGFIQTREQYKGKQKFGNIKDFNYYIDTRTNYRIDLNQSLDTFLMSMNSSSRRYSRKFLLRRKNFRIIKVKRNQEKLIEKFSNLYFENSQNLNFSSNYIFHNENWIRLLENDSFSLLLLYYKETIISGTVITKLEKNIDLTFTVNSNNFNNAGKATVLFLFKYFRKKNKNFFDLGGGVKENDGITKFKISMGAYPISFKRLRFIHNDIYNGKTREGFLDMNKKWP